MERTMSATDARVHFGEVLRQVAQENKRIIVERSGRAQVVILSLSEYERLKAAGEGNERNEALRQAIQVAERIRTRRQGQPLTPPPEEIIRQMREERGEQLTDLR